MNPPARVPIISDPERVLLIRPSALGDVCRTVPVAASLKSAFPTTTLHWLVNEGLEDAVSAHPAVDAVVPFPRKRLGRAARSLRLGRVISWLNDRRVERYDLVIDAQGLGRSGGIAWWTHARIRVGFADARELGWLGCSHRVQLPATTEHTVDRMLGLVAHLGIDAKPDMRLYPPQDDIRWVAGQQELAGRYAVIAPTSIWPAKRWPINRFADLAEWLADRPGLDRVVIVGAPNERAECAPLLDRFSNDPRVLNLVGQTPIGQLLAVIAGSSLVIANDSAAAHMAVGCDRPLVCLFGPTNIARVGPYRRDADVIQHMLPQDSPDKNRGKHPSHKDPSSVRIIERITLDEVIAACAARLSSIQE